jgi:hypothetical protein
MKDTMRDRRDPGKPEKNFVEDCKRYSRWRIMRDSRIIVQE